MFSLLYSMQYRLEWYWQDAERLEHGMLDHLWQVSQQYCFLAHTSEIGRGYWLTINRVKLIWYGIRSIQDLFSRFGAFARMRQEASRSKRAFLHRAHRNRHSVITPHACATTKNLDNNQAGGYASLAIPETASNHRAKVSKLFSKVKNLRRTSFFQTLSYAARDSGLRSLILLHRNTMV
jgi:hypothetical protein